MMHPHRCLAISCVVCCCCAFLCLRVEHKQSHFHAVRPEGTEWGGVIADRSVANHKNKGETSALCHGASLHLLCPLHLMLILYAYTPAEAACPSMQHASPTDEDVLGRVLEKWKAARRVRAVALPTRPVFTWRASLSILHSGGWCPSPPTHVHLWRCGSEHRMPHHSSRLRDTHAVARPPPKQTRAYAPSPERRAQDRSLSCLCGQTPCLDRCCVTS